MQAGGGPKYIFEEAVVAWGTQFSSKSRSTDAALLHVWEVVGWARVDTYRPFSEEGEGLI